MMTNLKRFYSCLSLRLRKVRLIGPYFSTLRSSRLMNMHCMSPSSFSSVGRSSGSEFISFMVVSGKFWKYSDKSKEYPLIAERYLLEIVLKVQLNASKFNCFLSPINQASLDYSCLLRICKMALFSYSRFFFYYLRLTIYCPLAVKASLSSFSFCSHQRVVSMSLAYFSLTRWYSSTIFAYLSTNNLVSVCILFPYSPLIWLIADRAACFTRFLFMQLQEGSYIFIQYNE